MTDMPERPVRQPRKIWNYTPALPIKNAPYWEWPMKPMASALFLLKSWNPVGMRFVMLAAAAITWLFFSPDLERAQTLSFDWIAEIWLRNFVILVTVAGGLHLLLLKFRAQGDAYRYDMRPMMTGARAFWFKNQVYDNMFWSFVALQFWVFFECMMWWAYANGWATLITFESNPVWFVLLIVLVPIWAGLYFYMHHRVLHMGPMYKHVHSWHHKNVNTGPWSGLAMHPVESFVLLTDVLVFLIIPSNPLHMLFLMFHHGIGAPTSHVGFDKVKTGVLDLEMGDFHHQLHHKFFDCNYGTAETPWDEWFNTFHDGTPEGNELIKERRRKIWQTT